MQSTFSWVCKTPVGEELNSKPYNQRFWHFPALIFFNIPLKNHNSFFIPIPIPIKENQAISFSKNIVKLYCTTTTPASGQKSLKLKSREGHAFLQRETRGGCVISSLRAIFRPGYFSRISFHHRKSSYSNFPTSFKPILQADVCWKRNWQVKMHSYIDLVIKYCQMTLEIYFSNTDT